MGNSKTFDHYHSKGQKDYGKREYNPPYGSLINDIFGRSDFDIDCDKAYDAGYHNAKNQSKK
ncbi:MAG: hypothetical protein E3K37_02430 [Candidatus Kuenenia sp.]|nr:hypothetical protein [Candidatus Kuenenia hertensis]